MAPATQSRTPRPGLNCALLRPLRGGPSPWRPSAHCRPAANRRSGTERAPWRPCTSRAPSPSEPASLGSRPGNAFWALSLPGVWVAGSPPSLRAACNSSSLASAYPHLRDHSVSQSLPCWPHADLTTGHTCCPRMCRHKPVGPASTPAPLQWGQPKTPPNSEQYSNGIRKESMSPSSHKMPALNLLLWWGALEDPAGVQPIVKAAESPASTRRGPGPQLALSNPAGHSRFRLPAHPETQEVRAAVQPGEGGGPGLSVLGARGAPSCLTRF